MNHLIDKYIDNEITVAEAAQLESWLLASRDNVMEFVRETHQHRQLRDMTMGMNAHAAISPIIEDATKIRSGSYVSITVAIVAALLLIGGIGWLLPNLHVPAATPKAGSLVHAIDCHWAGQSDANIEGDLIRVHDRLMLREGLAEVELDNGVSVILQDKTTIKLVSASELQLYSGTITANVPDPNVRFTVVGPGVTVFDLGTQFGMTTDGRNTTEVHVFTGLVEAQFHDRGKAQYRSLRLGKNAAASYNVDNQMVNQCTARREKFVHRLGPTAGRVAFYGKDDSIMFEAERFSHRSGFGTQGEIWTVWDGTAAQGQYVCCMPDSEEAGPGYEAGTAFDGAWLDYEFRIDTARDYQVWLEGRGAQDQSEALQLKLFQLGQQGDQVDAPLEIARKERCRLDVGDEFSWTAVEWGNGGHLKLEPGRYRL